MHAMTVQDSAEEPGECGGFCSGCRMLNRPKKTTQLFYNQPSDSHWGSPIARGLCFCDCMLLQGITSSSSLLVLPFLVVNLSLHTRLAKETALRQLRIL